MLSSKIVNVTKPAIHFDASNLSHRALATMYLKTRSWAHTTERFIVEYPYTNVVTMINDKLIKFYTSIEFAPTNADTAESA